jgi:phosphoglycolate phosphatase
MIRHIIWDWNGTLVDDVDLCVEILNQELTIRNISEISVRHYKQKFFFPVNEFYKTLGLPSNGTEYECLNKTYIQQYRTRYKECDLHFGARETLKKLNSKGISHSILSAGKQSDVESFTNHFGVHSLFLEIDGASNIQAKGKDERASDHLSRLGFHQSEVILVGDSCHDWEVGQLLGCNVILFEHGHVDGGRLKMLNSCTINYLSQVCNWVHD